MAIRHSTPIHWLLSAFILLCVAAPAHADMPDAQKERHGWVQMAGGATPPAFPGSGWHPVQLPDNWNRSHPDTGGQAWYHFKLPLDRLPSGLWAIYLPRASMNAAAFVNGQLVGSGGSFAEPMARNWNRPLLFDFPASLLHAGDNSIDIRVAGYANSGAGLNPLYVAKNDTLQPVYQRQFGLQITLSVIAFLLMAGLSLLVFALWLLRRHETMYLMFVLCSVSSAIFTLNVFLVEAPLPHQLWTWLWLTSGGVYVYFVVLFMHRFIGLSRPRLERVCLAYTVGGPLIIAAAGSLHMTFHFAAWGLGYVLLSIYVLSMIFRHRHHNPGESWVILIALSLSASSGYYDLGKLFFSRQHTGPFIFHLGPMLLGIAVAFLLLMRFVNSMRQHEALNAELNARVEEKNRELETSYRHLAELEKEQAVFGERERIMRDLHDGLGGYLVSALAYTEKANFPIQPLHDTIRAALNDLRLMIDSLDGDPSDIASLLGSVRERLESSMSMCGAVLHWHINDAPSIPHEDASSSLHIMRMIQEAFTNIAKHSQATEVHFRAGPGCIEIRDNGQGFDAGREYGGRGLQNLHKRARLLDMQLEITSSAATGTNIRLSW